MPMSRERAALNAFLKAAPDYQMAVYEISHALHNQMSVKGEPLSVDTVRERVINPAGTAFMATPYKYDTVVNAPEAQIGVQDIVNAAVKFSGASAEREGLTRIFMTSHVANAVAEHFEKSFVKPAAQPVAALPAVKGPELANA